MNSCTFVGQMKERPSLKLLDRSDGNNTSIVNFTLEVSRIFRKKNGEEKQQTYCFDFEAWDTGANLIHENFDKGDWISVHASAKTDRAVDRDTGKSFSRVKFRVNEFEIPKWTDANAKESLTGELVTK